MAPLLKLQRIILGTTVKKARVFVPTKSFQPGLIFESKAGAYPILKSLALVFFVTKKISMS